MIEKLRHYRDSLVYKAKALIEEIEKDKLEFVERYLENHKGAEGYTMKENVATFDEEKEAVEDFIGLIMKIELNNIAGIEEFKEMVFKVLGNMYEKVPRLRAGVRMVIESVKGTFK